MEDIPGSEYDDKPFHHIGDFFNSKEIEIGEENKIILLEKNLPNPSINKKGEIEYRIGNHSIPKETIDSFSNTGRGFFLQDDAGISQLFEINSGNYFALNTLDINDTEIMKTITEECMKILKEVYQSQFNYPVEFLRGKNITIKDIEYTLAFKPPYPPDYAYFRKDFEKEILNRQIKLKQMHESVKRSLKIPNYDIELYGYNNFVYQVDSTSTYSIPIPDERVWFNFLREINPSTIIMEESSPTDDTKRTEEESINTTLLKNLIYEYAVINNVPVETLKESDTGFLDEKTVTGDYSLLYNRLNKLDPALTEHDFYYMTYIHQILHPVAIHAGGLNKPVNFTLLDIQIDNNWSHIQKKAYENARRTMSSIENSTIEEKSENLRNLLEADKALTRYNQRAKEIFYQEKIAKIIEENPTDSVFALFNNSPTNGLPLVLGSTLYRTELPDAKLLWYIAALKDIK